MGLGSSFAPPRVFAAIPAKKRRAIIGRAGGPYGLKKLFFNYLCANLMAFVVNR
jgi:hypothetical protein